MGLFGKLFGSRSPEPDESVDSRLLLMIREQLLASGVPAAADVAVEGRQLVTRDRRLAITVEVREVTAEKVHAHVISWLPNRAAPDGADILDACVMGFGPTASATQQAAEVWLRVVGAPVLSSLSAQVVLDADHFTGDEPWGYPRRARLRRAVRGPRRRRCGGHGRTGPE